MFLDRPGLKRSWRSEAWTASLLVAISMNYALAREFVSRLGRFSSPDPLAGNIANPQSLNRYAYVQNDPINLLDPEGEYMECDGLMERDDYSDGTYGPWNVVAMSCYDIGGGGGGGGASSGGGGGGGDILSQLGLTPPAGPPPLSKEWCDEGLKMAGQTMDAVDTAKDPWVWDQLAAAAEANNIDPALLAAVGVRETGFNDVWQGCTTEASCAKANGAGNFQIDLSPGTNVDVSVDCAFNLECSANVASNLLNKNMNFLRTAHPNFTSSQLTQATAATYNMGLGRDPVGKNVSGNPATIDVGTTPGPGATAGNYGLNILLLMHCFD